MRIQSHSLFISPLLLLCAPSCGVDTVGPLEMETDSLGAALGAAGASEGGGVSSAWVVASPRRGCHARVRVSAPDGLATSEGGQSARLIVELSAPPRGRVTVSARSSDVSEGQVSPSLVFDANSWRTPQTITVTGQADASVDGDQAYRVRFSVGAPADPCYASIQLPGIDLINRDTDVAALAVVARGSRTTTERGGAVTLDVALTSAPSADVSVNLAVTDATEATAAPTALVFTPSNWDQPQPVVVRGVGDLLADGRIAYYVVFTSASSDALYGKLEPRRFELYNLDGAAFSGVGTVSGDTSSAAMGVSGDGRVVVGFSSGATGGHAFRWKPGDGMLPLNGLNGQAHAISRSGDSVAGVAVDSTGSRAAVRWENGADPVFLPVPYPRERVYTLGTTISGDGSTIGGWGNWLSPTEPWGMYWRGEGVGQPAYGMNYVTGASEDGSILVGNHIPGRYTASRVAMLNEQPLPFPPITSDCYDATCGACTSPYACWTQAAGVSGDGSVVVGSLARTETAQPEPVAVKWTPDADGVLVLSPLTSYDQPSAALAVSTDGTIVVGQRWGMAARWAGGRADDIWELFYDEGIFLSWTLTAVRDVSDDGQVLVGEGINPQGALEGWIAVLPKQPTP